MAPFKTRLLHLSRAAWRLRAASPAVCDLPFALALFTDDRRQPDLRALVERLPSAPVIPPVALVFRHDGLPGSERLTLAETIRSTVQSKGHLFFMARGLLPGADGAHQAPNAEASLHSVAVHNVEEAVRARNTGSHLCFVSRVFPTKSHPDAKGLGPVAAAELARRAVVPAFALGGITAETSRRLRGMPFVGMGVIGAWSAPG